MISLNYTTKEETNLTELLKKLFDGSSATKLKKLYSQNRVMRNGFLADKDAPIKAGESISILKKHSYIGDIAIYYEDSDLIVVEKPAFLLSVDSDKAPGQSLHSLLKRRYGPVFPVHRLDRETTGVMVFTRNRNAKEALAEQFEKRSVSREYIAVTHGVIEKDGTWNFKLFEGTDKKMRVDNRGKDALTTYKVLKTGNGNSLIKCILSTGRKNQIRAHAAHVGHPLIGDSRYGNGKKKSPLYLHAHTLSFDHPKAKKRLSFCSPIPKGFRKKVF